VCIRIEPVRAFDKSKDSRLEQILVRASAPCPVITSAFADQADVSINEFIPGGEITGLGATSKRDLFIGGQNFHGSSLGKTAPGREEPGAAKASQTK